MSGAPRAGAHRRSVDDIERDIERTQREMSRTIQTIQHRLSPDHMKAKAKVRMRETSRGMMDKVKDHPAAAAMIGLGAWMLMRDKGSDRIEYSTAYENFDVVGCGVCGATFEESEHGWADRVRDGASSAGERVREGASSAAHRVSETTSNAAHRVSESTSNAAHRVAETSSRAAQNVGERARRIRQNSGMRARTMARATGRSYEENPFILGGVGLVLGALLGAAIPESERERELMGPARDRALERARDAAREKGEQVRHVAEAAKDAAIREGKNEARREGLVDDEPANRITTP
jgi:ElaB/YqjD/DUF883 family membrane-anchored ribosome-binding protein